MLDHLIHFAFNMAQVNINNLQRIGLNIQVNHPIRRDKLRLDFWLTAPTYAECRPEKESQPVRWSET